jgi:hypothetical protein
MSKHALYVNLPETTWSLLEQRANFEGLNKTELIIALIERKLENDCNKCDFKTKYLNIKEVCLKNG